MAWRCDNRVGRCSPCSSNRGGNPSPFQRRVRCSQVSQTRLRRHGPPVHRGVVAILSVKKYLTDNADVKDTAKKAGAKIATHGIAAIVKRIVK